MRVDCHPEQAFFAQRRARPELAEGIWASRAMCRVFCDTIIARSARFLIALLSILAFCSGLAAPTPQDLLASGRADQAIQTLERKIQTAPTAEAYNLLCRA